MYTMLKSLQQRSSCPLPSSFQFSYSPYWCSWRQPATPSAFHCLLMTSRLPLQRKYVSIASNIAIHTLKKFKFWPYTVDYLMQALCETFQYENVTAWSIYIFLLMQCKYGSVATNIALSIISFSSICYAIHVQDTTLLSDKRLSQTSLRCSSLSLFTL